MELIHVHAEATKSTWNLELQASSTDQATPDTGLQVLQRDSRQGIVGSGGSAIITSHGQPGTLIGAGASVFVSSTPADVAITLFDRAELSILPGQALNIISSTNVATGVVVFWRERALEESERT